MAPGTRTFWPSVATNAEGDMGITFAMSGPNIHPGAGFALRAANDPPGTLRQTETLRSGVASYVFLANTRNRWGDYTGVDSDPATGCFWSYNEYTMRWNAWGTAWGEECVRWVCGDGEVDPGETCDPPGPLPGGPIDCREGCTYCGDSNVDAGELCDDGNHSPGDGCAADCTPEFCGDDGNNDTDDDCQSFCEPCPENVFPTIAATSTDRFEWEMIADVSYVVGDLASVSSLAGTQQFETLTSGIHAATLPAAGSGLFYLVRYGCPGSTWSSGGPAEAGDRDSVMP